MTRTRLDTDLLTEHATTHVAAFGSLLELSHFCLCISLDGHIRLD